VLGVERVEADGLDPPAELGLVLAPVEVGGLGDVEDGLVLQGLPGAAAVGGTEDGVDLGPAVVGGHDERPGPAGVDALLEVTVLTS
jgi:hypothetical protein